MAIPEPAEGWSISIESAFESQHNGGQLRSAPKSLCSAQDQTWPR